MAKLKRVLWYLLGGTRGGPLRIRILRLIRDRPYNTNQIAEILDIDYKTAQHHLKVLTENNVVSSTGQKYGAVFLPTPAMEESWELFDEIAAQLTDDEDDASLETEPGTTGDDDRADERPDAGEAAGDA